MTTMKQQALIDPSHPRWRDLDAPGVRWGLDVPRVPTEWRLSAFTGRFGEISGDVSGASLTLVFRLVHVGSKRGQRDPELREFTARRRDTYLAVEFVYEVSDNVHTDAAAGIGRH